MDTKKREDQLIGLLHERGLPDELAERCDRLCGFREEGGQLHFDIERHPSLVGHKTKGLPSAGFFVVVQTWFFDPEKTAEDAFGIVDETYVDIRVEHLRFLVEGDVENTVDGYSSEIADLKTDTETEAWARTRAEEISGIIRETTFPPTETGEVVRLAEPGFMEKWDEYLDAYLSEWETRFIEEAVLVWRRSH